MNGLPELRLDWCTSKAARYACENWHYSGVMPAFKTSKVGVWEGGLFIGCLVFTNPMPPTRKRFKCSNGQITELARVALRGHTRPVSKMIRIALKFVKKANPGLRVCVSYADSSQGHHGGIYQASGFKYFGSGAGTDEYFYKGRWVHARSIGQAVDTGKLAKGWDLPKRKSGKKHCYALELDKKSLALLHLEQKPYPKRVSSDTSDTPAFHAGKAGATPSDALQKGGD
tara:strand:- start:86 stop:769 length:684 start_codon:yes stop_codon:yes gene_type:complete